MAYHRTRISRVSNRHAPYRQTEAFAALVMAWSRSWLTGMAARLFRGRAPAPTHTSRSFMYVCSCKAITEAQVRAAAAVLPNPRMIAVSLGLDDPSCCGRCFRDLDRIALIAADSIVVREPAVLSR